MSETQQLPESQVLKMPLKKTRGRPRKALKTGPLDPASENSSIDLTRVPKASHPVGRPGLTRKEAALERLKVTPSKLAAVPNITAILKEIPHGRVEAFKAMQFSESPLIRKFLDRYYRIPMRDRMAVPIEAVAIAAKVDVRHLWGEIMLAMREISVNAVKTVAVAGHVKSMQTRVECAQTPEGYRDRDALDIMLGALPSRQGPTFINKFFAAKAGGDDDEKPEKEEVVDDLDYLFPEASAIQERVQNVRQKLLDSGK